MKIYSRARCIWENDYDPLFNHNDSLNRKYWWKRPIIKIPQEDGFMWLYDNQLGDMVEMVVTTNDEVYNFHRHICWYIDNNRELPETWRNKLLPYLPNVTDLRTVLVNVGVNDRRWKPLSKCWFNAYHIRGLHVCFANREDSLQARFRVMKHLQTFHENQFPDGSGTQFITDDGYTTPHTTPPTTPPNITLRPRVPIRDRNINNNLLNFMNESDTSDSDTENEPVFQPPRGVTDEQRMLPRINLTNIPPPPPDTQPINVTVSDSTTCGICWDVLGEANVMVTKCGHKFCCDCILSHFQNAAGNNCPLCRVEYASRVPGWIPPEQLEDRPTNRRPTRPPTRRRTRDNFLFDEFHYEGGNGSNRLLVNAIVEALGIVGEGIELRQRG
jgi:hypothetical protein